MAKPDKCISVQQARDLHDNWVSTREGSITAMRNGTQDTREFLWSVSELEEYLEYVKSESKKQGFNSPGIRVYLGAYNDNQSTNATVFFAPTEDAASAGAKNNYNIDAYNLGTAGWPPKNY